MTRDELIARIEAGETGAELLCAIADIVGWRPRDGADLHEIIAYYSEDKEIAVRYGGVPPWLTSLDASVALIGDQWIIAADGHARILDPGNSLHTAYISDRPAAALVAAWLKATA